MILQSLADYYLRESARKGSRIAPLGLEKKEIKFLIEIDEDGEFVNLVDTRDDGKNGKIYLVPKAVGRSGSDSWKIANLLWDHYGYVLGQSQAGKVNLKAPGQLTSFKNRLKSLPEEIKSRPGVAAIIKFYEKNGPEKVIKHEYWDKCNKIAGCNLTFILCDDAAPVTEDNQLRTLLSMMDNDSEASEDKVHGRCLVTGQIGEIARTHSKIGLGGNQATLVGFQRNSGYDSYGKEQGYNAPISTKAEFYYITALNTLLKAENNHARMGDVTLVFWGAPRTLSDEYVASFEQEVKATVSSQFDTPVQGPAAPNIGAENVKNIIESIFTGKVPSDIGDRFYVLGLAPNKARISVVLWKSGSIKEIARNICQYQKDITVIRDEARRAPTLRDILSSSEFKGKVENVPTNMGPALVYAVFNGSQYPSSLFGHIMQRVRAERNPNAVRCAYIKAYLNRKYKHSKGAEIKVALDKENKNPAYRLGRLFAVLEKVQEEANPGINSTIRDRFYSAMSSSPAAVFPMLLRLKNHHLEKLVPGRKINFETEIADIFSELQPETLPKHLSLEEQGYFALGYYHQRQDLFTKKEK